MEFLEAFELVVLAAICILLPLVALTVRRRYLARYGAAFECSARLDLPIADATPGSTSGPTPNPRWVLGVGCYRGEFFEWYRFFSLSLRPRLSWHRREIVVRETRDPDALEATSLYASHRIVRFGVGEDVFDVAMDAGSVTGFLAWLEAAPPGLAPSNE